MLKRSCLQYSSDPLHRDAKQNISANWFRNVCLPQVFEALANEKPKTGIKGIILHHDNTRPYIAAIIKAYLEENKIKIMPQPPYSPDIAPYEFLLDRKLKLEFI